MLLNHMPTHEYHRVIALLAWSGVLGSTLSDELQRHLRVAITGLVVDADAQRVDGNALCAMILDVIAVVLQDDWYSPEKDFIENNTQLRQRVVSARQECANDVALVAREFEEFLSGVEEQFCARVAEHFQEEIFPKMVLFADHVFAGAEGH